jgi:hypothetical protein
VGNEYIRGSETRLRGTGFFSPRDWLAHGLQTRTTRPQHLVLALFAIGTRPQYPGLRVLIEAINEAGVPDGTIIHAGTYGANRATGDAIAALPSGIYAPMFSIRPTGSRAAYAGRRLPEADLAKLDPRYAGPIPLRTPGKPLPRDDYLHWGRELGFRFRDSLRRGRDNQPLAISWQFDEIVDEVVGGLLADPYRLYTAGILQGLHFGRKALGDMRQRGVVWGARLTLAPLPELPTPTGSPLALLWDAIDNAARLYAGEEYVDFDGDPARTAERSATGQRRLLAAGPIPRRIGHKYLVGMTPGFIPKRGLGGNIHGWELAKVNAWRDRFVAMRAELTPLAGFGQFNLTGENARPDVMRTAIEAAAMPFPI